MRQKALLTDEGRLLIKDICIFEDPEKLKGALSSLSWKILILLKDGEMYPIEIARKLHVQEQKIYYHIKKLRQSGIVEISREAEIKGASAKYYRLRYPAFGIELPFGDRVVDYLFKPEMGRETKRFFDPFIKDGYFNGKIVVGCPDPHGPFKARARDGHYAAHLTFFLGQFIKIPDTFTINLDVDVKAEKEEKKNLILVGGPGTNLLTQEVNDHMPTKFNMLPSEHGFLFGGLISQKTKKVYTSDTIGVVSRIVNPWDREKYVIVLAGNKAVGTKACVIALTKFWNVILKDFKDTNDFAVVIQGFDLDGDGKVDAIEVIE